jgi:hypothetical protein
MLSGLLGSPDNRATQERGKAVGNSKQTQQQDGRALRFAGSIALQVIILGGITFAVFGCKPERLTIKEYRDVNSWMDD